MADEKLKTVKFMVGSKYTCANHIQEPITFACTSRSPKFVTLRDVAYGKTIRVGVYATSGGVEYCYPLGKYSNRPTLHADHILND